MIFMKIFSGRRSLHFTLSLCLVVPALVLPSPAHAVDYFYRNLGVGFSGSDVFKLQVLLNTDSDTRVAAAGPGSPGFETARFGLLTRAAIVRFQKKYASEILFPGQAPTGFVGPRTLRKLNSLSHGSQNNESPAVPVANPFPARAAAKEPTPVAPQVSVGKTDITATDRAIEAFKASMKAAIEQARSARSKVSVSPSDLFSSKVGSVLLFYPSTHTGRAGDSFTIYGSGFTASNNTVYFSDSFKIGTVGSFTGDAVSVMVPEIPSGKYLLAFGNKNGLSNTTFFIVTDEASPAVAVESVMPAVVSYGETISVTGSGFTAAGNDVITNFGKISNVSSTDGKTLRFAVTPDSLRPAAGRTKHKSVKLKVPVYVANGNGLSSDAVFFTLNF